MARRIYVERNGHSEDYFTLIVVVICVVYGKEFLLLAACCVILWIMLKFLEAHEHMKVMRMVNEAAISMEADHQNMLHSQGDPYGTYGKYDAYTMPMTRSILDDYEDGLETWK